MQEQLPEPTDALWRCLGTLRSPPSRAAAWRFGYFRRPAACPIWIAHE